MHRHINQKGFAGAKALNKTTLAPVATPTRPTSSNPRKSPAQQRTSKGTSLPLAADEQDIQEKGNGEGKSGGRKVARGSKRMIVASDEEDEADEEEGTGTQARKSSESAVRPSKVRRTLSPAQESIIARAELPFLIRKLEHLNINDKHEKRKASGMYDFYIKCLNIYRETGAFVNIEASYMRSSELAANGWEANLAETFGADEYAYLVGETVQELLPEVVACHEHFSKNPDDAITVLNYIDKAGARGRTNDLGRLRDRILEYAGVTGRENLAHLANRGNRGFKDPTLGRLLCPVKKLPEFDADPAAFCRKVLERKDGYKFGAKRLPAYLFDEAKLSPGKTRAALFRSRIMTDAYKLIYQGPLAVHEVLGDSDGSTTQGQPSISDHYKIYEVTAERIIYVACLVRVLLASMPRWKAQDNAWKGPAFANTLSHVFCRPQNAQWAADLLGWWNKQIYGNDTSADDDGSDCEADDLMEEEEAEAAEDEEQSEEEIDPELKLAKVDGPSKNPEDGELEYADPLQTTMTD